MSILERRLVIAKYRGRDALGRIGPDVDGEHSSRGQAASTGRKEAGFRHDRGGAIPVVKVDQDEIVRAARILAQKHLGVAHVDSQSRGAGQVEIVMGHLNHLGPPLDHVDPACGKDVHQEPGK